MKTIIKRGIKSAPNGMGIKGGFFNRQFIWSRDEWIQKNRTLKGIAFHMKDEFYPTELSGGPIGDILILRNDGFVYVYQMDPWGDWQSEIFTHEVIAGMS